MTCGYYASLFGFWRYFGGLKSVRHGEPRACGFPTKGSPDANAMQKRVWKGFATENQNE